MFGPWPEGTQVAYFALGCFWGEEKKFWETPGVVTTAVGYMGGFTPNPTYEETCTGKTGHAETVLVAYDPAKVTIEELLKVFWEAHDPTQGMRQGNDIGTTYRSAFYYTTPEQKAAFEASRDGVPGGADPAPVRRDHHRGALGRGRRRVLLRRGLPPAVPAQGPVGLLRRRRHRRLCPVGVAKTTD